MVYTPVTCYICKKSLKRDYPAQKLHKGRCQGLARNQAVNKYRNKNAK